MPNDTNAIIGFHLPTEPHGCFSNWYYSRFTYAGICYNCAEQFMMARKVALGRRYDLYDAIMESSDPDEMKSLAGKENYPEFANIQEAWDRNCRHIVKQGIKAKFVQNEEMRKELLDTGNALLAECAGQDKTWGIGINLHNPKWHDVNNWNGSNYLGIILMEVREELRGEIRGKGEVQYIDFRNAKPILEWEMTAGQLRRIPQYYAAVHAYADQLKAGFVRNQFYQNTLADLEFSMRTNMGGGFPVAGFYEMKQEIYEISKRLQCRSFVSDVFREAPDHWGLRGDPFFWEDMKTEFAFEDLSMTGRELEERIRSLFEHKTGKELTEDTQIFVEEYAHGGISSGHLSGDWLLNECIPMLQRRLEKLQEEGKKDRSRIL